MWVKICGTTNLADAAHAVNSGADALGFIFAPSPRRVTAEQVRHITAHLPPQVGRYGVFVDAGYEEIVSTVEEAGLSGIQLHANLDPELASRLRTHFAARPEPVDLLHVMHFVDGFEQQLNAFERGLARDQLTEAILVDTYAKRAPGGTGQRFDWEAARPALRSRAGRLRLILAGGLNPENVAEAITFLEPWGVDVVSGVEASPGRKDAARVEAFIQNARRAASLLKQWKSPDPNKQ
jgi:phosphoribosylanthranilate isomerase